MMVQRDEPRITFLDVDENIASPEYVTHTSVGVSKLFDGLC